MPEPIDPAATIPATNVATVAATIARSAPGATDTSPAAALGRAQFALGQGDSARAVQWLSEAVGRAPQDASLWAGLGVALRFEARLDEAAQAFEQALQLQPGRPDVQVYLGMVRLAQGRQEEGWPLYQARWRSPHWTERMRYPLQALWQGRVGRGTRLLLWGEQGLGDCLQFARYAPWLHELFQAQAASVVLEVPKPLQRLLQHSWPQLEVVARGELRGRFDVHLPLMDLPKRWGGVGPGLLPYLPQPLPYLRPPPGDAATLVGAVAPPTSTGKPMPMPMPAPATTPLHAAVLASERRQPARALKVGVVWQGRPTHPDDRLRSLAPEVLQPLFEVPGLEWVSLQKDATQHPDWLPERMARCADFADTAAVLQGLDLVVSIDSAVAHLAGALGMPVFVLLPPVADWRWGLQGEHTPWYPQMRLFRRGAGEGWDAVMGRLAAALVAMATARDAGLA